MLAAGAQWDQMIQARLRPLHTAPTQMTAPPIALADQQDREQRDLALQVTPQPRRPLHMPTLTMTRTDHAPLTTKLRQRMTHNLSTTLRTSTGLPQQPTTSPKTASRAFPFGALDPKGVMASRTRRPHHRRRPSIKNPDKHTTAIAASPRSAMRRHKQPTTSLAPTKRPTPPLRTTTRLMSTRRPTTRHVRRTTAHARSPTKQTKANRHEASKMRLGVGR